MLQRLDGPPNSIWRFATWKFSDCPPSEFLFISDTGTVFTPMPLDSLKSRGRSRRASSVVTVLGSTH